MTDNGNGSKPLLPLEIDRAALEAELTELASYSDTPAPAVTRVLWSETDQQARAYITRLCVHAGLDVRQDAVGNLFASWYGSDANLPAVASGSHIDAIPHSGRYDGTVGVLGALEALRTLKRAGFEPRRTLELLVFTAEEPTRFGLGCLGSRMLAGTLGPDQARSLRDPQGRSFEELRTEVGLVSYDLNSVTLPENAYAAFLELHIEQGPLLDAAGIPIGIVEHIAAPASLRLYLMGQGGHAGAVLMPHRHDALLAGAEVALAVEQAAHQSGSPDTVATTGVFQIEPGAVNSIPHRATLEIDVRDIAAASRDQALADIMRATTDICDRRGINWEMTNLNADPPATCDPALVATLEQVCQHLGLPSRQMVSRAYHDALFMARLCPTSMIFVPCRAGISHHPDEYATIEAIAQGVAVLAHALAQLAA